MTIELKKVRSSQIHSIGYDAATHTLAVRFHNGGTYHYSDVMPDAHAALLKAKSIGGHLHHHIKGRHKYTRQDASK